MLLMLHYAVSSVCNLLHEYVWISYLFFCWHSTFGWFQSLAISIILVWIFLYICLGTLISAGYSRVLRHRESIRSGLVDNVKQLPKLSMPAYTTSSVGTWNLFVPKYESILANTLGATFLCLLYQICWSCSSKCSIFIPMFVCLPLLL